MFLVLNNIFKQNKIKNLVSNSNSNTTIQFNEFQDQLRNYSENLFNYFFINFIFEQIFHLIIAICFLLNLNLKYIPIYLSTTFALRIIYFFFQNEEKFKINIKKKKLHKVLNLGIALFFLTN